MISIVIYVDEGDIAKYTCYLDAGDVSIHDGELPPVISVQHFVN